MKTAIFLEETKYLEAEFLNEESFEKCVNDCSRLFFGENTLYFDIKNKIDSHFLGSSIPDGILFDFSDEANPEFYLVEIELSKHDFYKHIFPQITKFFAFFNNPSGRNNLIDKIFRYIKANSELEKKFMELLGKREVYKSIKDALENSQNILLIIDGDKPELDEVMDTYTDTWDKVVKVEIVKKYVNDNKEIITLTPDFEELGFDGFNEETKERNLEKYTEEFHTEGVDKKIRDIYEEIKTSSTKIDSEIKINPQHYYISLRKKRNFAFIKLRKKKILLVIMLPIEDGKKFLKYHRFAQLSEGIQRFYNGPCFKIVIDDEKNLQEVIDLIEKAYHSQE